MERANNPREVGRLWELYHLPKIVRGTFLDVGCWGGGFVREAHARDATQAVGIDSVPHITWDKYIPRVTFMEMDIYSPHFLSLPRFDVVLCAGVLYHVPDPVGLLQRLKSVVKDDGMLWIETAVYHADEPSMLFCAADSFDRNFSNWFIPSTDFISHVYSEVGFTHIDSFRTIENRAVWKLKLSGKMPHKFMPRKKEGMR